MATKTLIRRRPRIITAQSEQVAAYSPNTVLADTLTQIAYVFFAILEGLLIARFVLRLAGADPFHSVVTWVYNSTSFFVLPFESMFPSQATDGSVLEISTLVAMIGYLFTFYLAIALFRLFVPGEQIVDPEGNY